MAIVEIQDLVFSYPDTGFRLDIDRFVVGDGEKVAVIGPSGSGKTTLLALVSGILLPGAGTVTCAGTELSALGDPERRRFRITRIGQVFQDFELIEYLNVSDNVLHPYRITPAHVMSPAVRERAAGLLEDMGLGDKLYRDVGRLSRGERQRVAICRALLPGPELVLADEATGNLDPVNREHVLDLLFSALEKQGSSLLAVTHDHELLPRFDRAVDFSTFTGVQRV